MMMTRIIGTGSALPEAVLTNDDMSALVDTSDEWIASRTGIRTRHLAGKENTVSMASEAARRAMENAGARPEEIDLIIVATCSADNFFPNTACSVQKELGIPCTTAAFDMNVACAGFVYALHTVHAYFLAGIYRKALIVGVEAISRLIDWTDRSTCVLFGDGAGAAVVEPSEEGGVICISQHADGSLGDALLCENREIENPVSQKEAQLSYIKMNGQAVFKFAVTRVPECIREVLDQGNVDISEVSLFLMHQANERILQSVAKRLKVDMSKFPMNLQKYGNTSAASLPILLDEVAREGLIKRGDYVVLSGFGAGLTWGATLMKW